MQALCSHYGVAVGARAAPLVRVLLAICYPVAWPVSKVCSGHEFPLHEMRLYEVIGPLVKCVVVMNFHYMRRDYWSDWLRCVVIIGFHAIHITCARFFAHRIWWHLLHGKGRLVLMKVHIAPLIQNNATQWSGLFERRVVLIKFHDTKSIYKSTHHQASYRHLVPLLIFYPLYSWNMP